MKLGRNHEKETRAVVEVPPHANIDPGLLGEAVDGILRMMLECIQEKDVDIQQKRAKNVELLMDALVKFNYKIVDTEE